MSFDRDLLPEPIAFYESEGMHLIGSNKWRKTLCPFHDDHHPSLSINIKNGAFCCFSCQTKGGDIVSFLMQRDGLDFVSAVQRLGAWKQSGSNSDKKYARKSPSSLSAYDALGILKSESLLCAVMVANVASNEAISETDRKRLMRAVGRIQTIQELFYE